MNILVVDDEERNRVHLANFLNKLGHRVVTAGSAPEALEVLSAFKANLLLTDNRMPDMSGLELMRQVRSRPAGINMDMILFTAYGDMESSIEALRAGAFDYLLKPLNVEELVTVIERVAARQHLIPDQPGAGNFVLRDDPGSAGPIGAGELAVYSEAMHEVVRLAGKLHQNRFIPVLIEGETGTGKELIARYLHFGSENVDLPFVALNCAAISGSLFESELFGYESGSFSGALARGKKGKIDLARGGTLFLDEISEIPLELQAKLLRIIQEKEYYRVGGLELISSNVRIIGASNRDLKQAVAQGVFRQDLYYRLRVGHIRVPSLRERKDDIIPLAVGFLQEFSRQVNKHFRGVSPAASKLLLDYEWPGNVRELRNIMEWVVLTENDYELKPEHLSLLDISYAHPSASFLMSLESNSDWLEMPEGGMPLDQISNTIILRTLQLFKGNKAATARYLGISRSALYYRLKAMDANNTL